MRYKLPSGHIILLDKEDAWLLEKYHWHLVSGYAQTETGNRKLGTRKTQRLHRLILSPLPTELVDHINRNPLDNRRRNLRLATKSTNGMNRPAQLNNTSGFKGVSFHEPTERWRAYITRDKRTTHLGLFDTKQEAAKAYLRAAKTIHGEFLCV